MIGFCLLSYDGCVCVSQQKFTGSLLVIYQTSSLSKIRLWVNKHLKGVPRTGSAPKYYRSTNHLHCLCNDADVKKRLKLWFFIGMCKSYDRCFIIALPQRLVFHRKHAFSIRQKKLNVSRNFVKFRCKILPQL